jgi:membrane-associated phospholipid phosphatase
MTRVRAPDLLLSGAVAFFALDAHATDPERVEWSSDWPRFRRVEIAFTSAMALQVAAATFLYPEPVIRWEGGILFDDAVRDAAVSRNRSGRNMAASWSDGIYYVLAAYPFVIDTAIVTAGIHRSGDVTVQMLAMNLETYAFAGAIVSTATTTVGRARPMTAECRTDPSYGDKCENEASLATSFISGHTAISFASAGLTCAHHQHLPLYVGGASDLGVCVTTLTAAAANGALRVVSDNHWTTDVLLGTSVGLFTGYFMPSLLHYGFTSGPAKRASLLPSFEDRAGGTTFAAVLSPDFASERLGVRLVGVF